jgi:hypothetical protein
MEELATEMVLLERGSSTTRISLGSVNLTGQVAFSTARGDKRGRIVCAFEAYRCTAISGRGGTPLGGEASLGQVTFNRGMTEACGECDATKMAKQYNG